MIPRKLLHVFPDSKIGFCSIGLLHWFLTKPLNPITREPVDRIVIDCLYSQIDTFLANDLCLKRRQGHYKKRAAILKVLRAYTRRFYQELS
jgi:hypothetical protein